jgi:hypothetical protein
MTMYSVPEYNLYELGPWDREDDSLFSAPDPRTKGHCVWWDTRDGCYMDSFGRSVCRSTLWIRSLATGAILVRRMRGTLGRRSRSGSSSCAAPRPTRGTTIVTPVSGSGRGQGGSRGLLGGCRSVVLLGRRKICGVKFSGEAAKFRKEICPFSNETLTKANV